MKLSHFLSMAMVEDIVYRLSVTEDDLFRGESVACRPGLFPERSWVVWSGQMGTSDGLNEDGTPFNFKGVSTYNLPVQSLGGREQCFVLTSPGVLPLRVRAFASNSFPVSDEFGPMEATRYEARVVNIHLMSSVIVKVDHRRQQLRPKVAGLYLKWHTLFKRFEDGVASLSGEDLFVHVMNWKVMGLDGPQCCQPGQRPWQRELFESLCRWLRSGGMDIHTLQKELWDQVTENLRAELLALHRAEEDRRRKNLDFERLEVALRQLAAEGFTPFNNSMVDEAMISLRETGRVPSNFGPRLGRSMPLVLDVINSCRLPV